MRGDWSNVDGRTMRSDLEEVADAIDNPEADIASIRVSLGICPFGGGHWLDYCVETCNDSDMKQGT